MNQKNHILIFSNTLQGKHWSIYDMENKEDSHIESPPDECNHTIFQYIKYDAIVF